MPKRLVMFGSMPKKPITASEMGRKGGSSRSEAKVAAARANAAARVAAGITRPRTVDDAWRKCAAAAANIVRRHAMEDLDATHDASALNEIAKEIEALSAPEKR